MTHIIRGKTAHRRLVAGESGIHHGRLFLLELNDTTLDTVFDNELDGLHRPVLTQTVDTVHSLCKQIFGKHWHVACLKAEILTVLDGWIPPAVHKVDARGFRQIQRDTSGLQADKEDSNMYVVHCGAL